MQLRINKRKRKPLRNSKFKMQNSKLQKGFTLVELLVVMMIIGVLFAILMVNFKGVKERTRDGQRKSDLRQIQSALELYRADQGRYPDSPLPTCGSSLTGGSPPTTYIQKVPCDPLSAASYQYSSSGTSYCLRTCLDNTNDSERDQIKYGSDNPSITGCTLSNCLGETKSFTLQNP